MRCETEKQRLAWAYIVGVYLGDGCVTKAKQKLVFRMGVTDQDFAEATVRALAELSDGPTNMCICNKGEHQLQFHIRCWDSELSSELQRQTNFKTEIPAWVFEAPRQERLAFVAGLMDSEGYVLVRNGKVVTLGFKSTDDWFERFVELLNGLGIETGKVGIEQPRKPGYRQPRRFAIRFGSWIAAGGYFNIRRKQEKIEQWAVEPTKRRRQRQA